MKTSTEVLLLSLLTGVFASAVIPEVEEALDQYDADEIVWARYMTSEDKTIASLICQEKNPGDVAASRACYERVLSVGYPANRDPLHAVFAVMAIVPVGMAVAGLYFLKKEKEEARSFAGPS